MRRRALFRGGRILEILRDAITPQRAVESTGAEAKLSAHHFAEPVRVLISATHAHGVHHGQRQKNHREVVE